MFKEDHLLRTKQKAERPQLQSPQHCPSLSCISCLKGAESRAVLTADAFVPNGSSSSLHPLVAGQEKGQCQLLQASLAPSRSRSAPVPLV